MPPSNREAGSGWVMDGTDGGYICDRALTQKPGFCTKFCLRNKAGLKKTVSFLEARQSDRLELRTRVFGQSFASETRLV